MEQEAEEVLSLVKKSSKVRLQEREYQVLSELEKWGLLGLGQLEGLLFWTGSVAWEREKFFWNDYDREVFDRYGYKRLRRLERAGYIRRFYQRIGFHGHFGWAYGLTKAGKAELEAAGLSGGLGVRRSWSAPEIPGHVRRNAVGLLLSKALGLRVKSRHQLACESRAPGLRESQVQSRIPDLLIEGKTALAMIVEEARSWKTELKRWQTLRERPLLYLTHTRGSRLLARAKQAGASHVWAAGLDEFRGQLGATVCANPDQKTATLDELTGRSGSPWGTG